MPTIVTPQGGAPAGRGDLVIVRNVVEELSWSALAMALRCGHQFERRYVNGEVRPPGVAAHRGHAVHSGAETNWIQKMQTGDDLPAATLTELMVAAFDERASRDGVHLSPEDESRGAAAILAEEKDALPSYARSFRAWAARVRPEMVEQEATIPAEIRGRDGVTRIVRLTGRLDLIAEILGRPGIPGGGSGILVDQKTSTRKKGQATVDADDQLTWYAMLSIAKGWLPGPIDAARMAMVTVTPKEAEEIFTGRQAGHLRALLNRIAAVVRGIEAGVLPPAARSDWLCLSLDTQVLTTRGWLGPGEVSLEDQVLTLNPYSHLLEYQHPVAAFVKRHEARRMIRYEGRSVRYTVTPDHEMLVRSTGRGRWRKAPAESLVGHGSVAYPVSAYLPRPGVALSDDELRLSGWLCAEGHFRTDSVNVEIAQNTGTPGWDEIAGTLSALGFDHSVYPCADRDHGKFFIKEDGARHIRGRIQDSKDLPGWLPGADGRQFRVWLTAFLNGDGHWHASGNASVGQKSEAFIDGLQALCLTHRMSAAKSGERVSSTGGHFHTLYIMDGITERVVESGHARRLFLSDCDAEEVWCVTVPNGTIVTRNSGRPLITGNCSPKWCGYWRDCPYFA